MVMHRSAHAHSIVELDCRAFNCRAMCNISLHCVCMQCDALSSLSCTTQTVYKPLYLLCDPQMRVYNHGILRDGRNLGKRSIQVVLCASMLPN